MTQNSATTMVDQLTSTLNSSFNGEQLFAGVNTDVKPIADYNAVGSPAKAAFDTAFQTYFGFPQSDPAAANISKPDMTNFLKTVVEPNSSALPGRRTGRPHRTRRSPAALR